MEIITVGDEVRKARLDRGLTQWNADDIVGSHRGFFNELEMNKRDRTIYVLHKAYLFLGYIPKTLNIDENSLGGKIYTHRIKNGLSLLALSKDVGLDKGTISRIEKGKNVKQESIVKMKEFLQCH